MKRNNNIGYTKEEYYEISSKQGLPNRCPILGNCCRAVQSRYWMGFKLVKSGTTFEEFLHSQGQRWEPDKMLAEIELLSFSHADDIFYSIENVCPEVTLFEPEYLPFKFKQSAFGQASYDKETRCFEAEAKHYSECAEFSEYWFHHKGQDKIKKIDLSSFPAQIPEKTLEDYLVDNLERLEAGLKFIERQKPIGNWNIDIFASDSLGVDVLIELKSKILNGKDIDSLCGQVSRYYNYWKMQSSDLRAFVVVPRSNQNILHNLQQGLKPLIESNKVTVFQFDYEFYSKQYIFSKIAFEL